MSKRRLTVICPGANESDARWERLFADQPRVFVDDPSFLMSFISVIEGEGFNEVTRVVFGPAMEKPAVSRFVDTLCALKECDVVHLRGDGEALVSRMSQSGRRTDLTLDRSGIEQYFAPSVEGGAFDVCRGSLTGWPAALAGSGIQKEVQA